MHRNTKFASRLACVRDRHFTSWREQEGCVRGRATVTDPHAVKSRRAWSSRAQPPLAGKGDRCRVKSYTGIWVYFANKCRSQ